MSIKAMVIAVEGLRPILREAAGSVMGIHVKPFADASYDGDIRSFIWGVAPMPIPFDPKSVTLTLQDRIYRSRREPKLVKAQADHASLQQKKIDDFWKTVEHQISAAIEEAAAPPKTISRCSYFTDLASELARHSGKTIVFTDGDSECAEPGILTPATKRPVFVVVLSSKSDNSTMSRAELFERRSRNVRRFIPAATIADGWDPVAVTSFLVGREHSTPVLVSDSAKEFVKAAPVAMKVSTTPAAAASTKPTGTSHNASEMLAVIVRREQRKHVPLSYSPVDGACFTERNLAQFIAANTPSRVAASVSSASDFLEAVSQLVALSEAERQAVYNEIAVPLHLTWTQLGYVSPEGQTDAAVKAEILVAQAIVQEAEQAMSRKREK